MALYEFEGKRPQIAPGIFVPETAGVIRDVVIGRECFIGVGARLRGDYRRIVIGDWAIIGEGAVVHGEIPDRG